MKNRSKIIKIKHYVLVSTHCKQLEIWFQTTKTGLLSQILLVQRKLYTVNPILGQRDPKESRIAKKENLCNFTYS